MNVRPLPLIALPLVLLLGGCSLFGGGGNADLYSFGDVPPPAAAPETAAVQPVAIAYAGAVFAPAIRGDRLLTISGAHAAYVAKSRWVTPADELFDAAIRAATDRLTPPVRLVGPGAAPPTDTLLQVEVRHFEAVYASPSAAPSVVVDARVTLIRRADRSLIGTRTITLSQPASDNRVAAIVSAFDAAATTAAGRVASTTQELSAIRPPG